MTSSRRHPIPILMSFLLVGLLVLLGGREERPFDRRASDRGTDFHQASDLALTAQTFETKNSARKNSVAWAPAMTAFAGQDAVVPDPQYGWWLVCHETTSLNGHQRQGFLGRAPPVLVFSLSARLA